MSATALIIDDDQELCALLAEFLVLEGFTASAVHDGAAAVDHCRDHAYDAIVLDVMLPGLQGLEVLRNLRTFSATPVLMLTARGADTDRIVGLEMGADDYLPKPCNPRELAARLRIALALAQENPQKAPDYLQRIEREGARLEELIGQLLASQQAGNFDPDTHVDLVALLQQLCNDANFEGAAQDKRVVLNNSLAQAIVPSSGDLLYKSFENILRNALHHTGSHTEVSVTVEPLAESYRDCVVDHGGGVPEPELERIFEAFYRTDRARSRDTGGAGLGLAIARRAILRHGGQVSAANSGTGLAVTVTLPRHNSDGAL